MINYNNSVVLQFDSDTTGNSGAEIPVTVRYSETQIKASLYSDDVGTIKDNPVYTGPMGNYNFFIDDGTYDIIINEGLQGEFTLFKETIGAGFLLPFSFTATEGQTNFILPDTFGDEPAVNSLYINGEFQDKVGNLSNEKAYFVSGNVIVFSEELRSGDLVTGFAGRIKATILNVISEGDRGNPFQYKSLRQLLNKDLSIAEFELGQWIETRGRVVENDGGGAIYQIAEFQTPDFETIIPLNDNFTGELVNGPRVRKHQGPTEIVAHRGFTDFNVEQTLYAFTSALEYGADSIECDIQVTSDGELVLFHDVFTEVLLEGITGEIKDNTFAQTQLATWREFADGNALKDKVHITKFTELLTYIQQVGCTLHAEIKSYRTQDDIALIVNTIEALNLEDLIVLHSFRLSDIQYVRNMNKTIRTSFLSNTLDGVDLDLIPVTAGFDWVKRDKNAVVALRKSAVDDPLNVPNPIVKEFHDAGVDVALWTLQNSNHIALARRNNIDILICDLPVFKR